ncbi:hypothetical protein SGRIM128S_08032 [Streptomyces griseomycini]
MSRDRAADAARRGTACRAGGRHARGSAVIRRGSATYAGSGRSFTTCFITSVDVSRCTPGSVARRSS